VPLDPHAKRFLDRLAAMNPPSALSLTVNARREALRHLLSFSGRVVQVACIENRSLPGPDCTLQLRVYTPINQRWTASPGLIYFHGGGFVAGNLDSHDTICRSLCDASGCRLISVEYRLAPEHPFPAALSDGFAATKWIAAHAADFGIDPARLALCGDSAGATLATVVCQMAAITQEVRVAMQFLLCPIMDCCADSATRQEYAEGYFVDEATLSHDLKYYLGLHTDRADPRVSPLRAPDLSRLPPTCLHTAEFDPLRDEGEAYAVRLRESGVETTYYCHSGMIHLFYGMGLLIPYAAAAYQLMGTDIRAMLV
jgi:acetyl esterase/lipase